MSCIVEIHDLQLKIKDAVILRDISLSIERGLIYGLVGRNGSGKSMLMKCLCGFVVPDSGSVLVNDRRIGVDCDFPDSIGVIIETPGFIPYYSGLKNLEVLASLRKKITREAIIDVMKTVGLDPHLKRPVRKYSLGMRQRLGIAQAIMEDPDLLVLDEPMNGLDKEGVVDMRRYLLDLKNKGKTIIIASHSAEDIEVLCDTVYEMEHGHLSKVV